MPVIWEQDTRESIKERLFARGLMVPAFPFPTALLFCIIHLFMRLLILLAFLFSCSLARAGESASFARAKEAYKVAAARYDVLGLQRSIALAQASGDIGQYEIDVLHGKALYHIAQALTFDGDTTMASQMLDKAMTILNRAVDEPHKDYRAHAWRHLVALWWRDIHDGRDHGKYKPHLDVAYVQKNAPDTALKAFVIIRDDMQAMEKRPTMSRAILERLRALSLRYPDNPLYKGYVLYMEGLTLPSGEERSTIVSALTDLLQEYPDAREIRYLRGKL
jgi:tetratricopeptide (TPR) repeat protein